MLSKEDKGSIVHSILQLPGNNANLFITQKVCVCGGEGGRPEIEAEMVETYVLVHVLFPSKVESKKQNKNRACKQTRINLKRK